MLTPGELRQFITTCIRISDEVSGDAGFVAVRDLLHRFNATIEFRPLLVEGMLAAIKTDRDYRWTVLIDSETHPIKQAQVETESSDKPLPTRTRNTIAHELAHTLAFRYSDFGIRLDVEGQRKTKLVDAIERATERLSPLLLIPDKALLQLARSARPGTSIDLAMLQVFRTRMGVSREVLINRLSLLREDDQHGLLALDAFRNVVIGIGEWESSTEAVYRAWPIFREFTGSLMPGFVTQVMRHDRTPCARVLPANWTEAATKPTIFSTSTGIVGVPGSETTEVRLEHEHVLPRKGAKFLFVITSTAESIVAKARDLPKSKGWGPRPRP